MASPESGPPPLSRTPRGLFKPPAWWRAARVWAVWAVWERLGRLVELLRGAWRRSLQLRMVTITLLVSTALVGAFGVLVVDRTSQNSLARAKAHAREQLDSTAEHAREQLSIHPRRDDQKLPRTTMPNIVESRSEGGRLVALVAPDEGIAPATTNDLPVTDAISQDLAVTVAGGQVAWQVVTAQLDPELAATTYLVYGAPVPARWGGPPFELYVFSPLDNEINHANDVRRTVLATGLALVLLLVAVTGLVTWLVVRPVRLAARTAQRLSAGLLDQRMVVNGEDDLAMLARSFNQMASNLQYQIVRLEEMSRLQRRFTSDVSHELRTPLTTIRMAADVLHAGRGAYPPEVARSAELLYRELDRFEYLLTDLLEISRFDAGFAALDSEATDLVPVVRQAVEQITPVGERAGVTIVTHLPDSPVIADVDARRVDRVLRNLLGNAVEHGRGKPVEVRLASDREAVAVTVRDYGVGLGAGEEKLVFNRFWRADQSRARQTGGTGLGLSISIEDAQLHGGWLEAWGEPGKGCQFRLTLPARAGARLTGSPLPLRPDNAGAQGPEQASARGPDQAGEPVVAERADSEPELAEPETGEPETGELETGELETGEPETGERAGRDQAPVST